MNGNYPEKTIWPIPKETMRIHERIGGGMTKDRWPWVESFAITVLGVWLQFGSSTQKVRAIDPE